ncbi:MAG: hypothetical protein A3D99_00805 [Candidatus Andersenbacteria bacterium RIFCSPHIGHO2_12_FULL_45_11]|uniref:Fido domain-containing protein n=1 Tax=Candidatus Andersenbacteria bacterium RIFCSPHIGHO2_12_FULL_45_11 TaxID=1797281 RepID=A0A1G1X5D5_9BACT|nr:MAG: hypothetical protein A3D99_00805 [Candidatus Andersenbacteria bacterium RIFCSPHIGHO2_12_FULL_45_11]
MTDQNQNEEELQKREAVGIIRASRFVRRFSRSQKPIDIEVVKQIHEEIFRKARPDIAGKFREEEIKIRGSDHRPPHHSQVPELMYLDDIELKKKLSKLSPVTSLLLANEISDQEAEMVDNILETAAWVHYRITYIHPFSDGNGRTARLAANLILERFGLVGISIKIERENKNRYIQALVQIDKMNDMEPLKNLILEGLTDRYDGVVMKYTA